MEELSSRNPVQRFGPFRFDSDLGILEGPEGEIHLRPKTYSLLQVLVERAPAVVAKDELLDRIWGQEHLGATSLAQAVGELRRALDEKPKAPRFIDTVHGRGYRFLLPGDNPIEVTKSPPAPAPELSVETSPAIDALTNPEPSRRPLWRLAGFTLVAILGATVLAVGLRTRGDQPVKAPTRQFLAADNLGAERSPVRFASSAVSAMAPSQVISLSAPELSTQRPARLAIMPLEVIGESLEPAWLGSALPELIAGRLQRAHEVFVYPSRRIAGMLRDLAEVHPLVASDAFDASYGLDPKAAWFRYLDADQIMTWTIETLAPGRWRIEVRLFAPDGSASANQTSTFRLADLGRQLSVLEMAVLERLGLSGRQSTPRRPRRLDLKMLEIHFEAARIAESDPRGALEILEQARGHRHRSFEFARQAAEVTRSLGDAEGSRKAVGRARLEATRPDEQIWLLNFDRRFEEALSRLSAAEDQDSLAELWLDTIAALAATPQAESSPTALAALSQLPPAVNDSWLAPELLLLEARLATRTGDPTRARIAAREARSRADDTGHRETRRMAQALLDDLGL